MKLLDRGALTSARPCLLGIRLSEKSTVNVAGWKLDGKRYSLPTVQLALNLSRGQNILSVSWGEVKSRCGKSMKLIKLAT